MHTPRGWRAIDVDGVAYLWTVKVGRDEIHDPVRIFVRRAERVADTRMRARGSTLIIETDFGGANRCGGPQCTVPLPPQQVGPGRVAAFVRQAWASGWDDSTPSFVITLPRDTVWTSERVRRAADRQ